MLPKIYFILSVLFILVMLFLGYYSWSWLQSIDKPETVVANFNSWAGYYTTFLWLSSLILLIVGNVLLWTRRNAWAVWVTLAYFALFILAEGFWLDSAYQHYRSSNNLTSELPFGAFLSVILCAVAAVIIFVDQFAILRLQERMFPPKELPAISNDSPPAAEAPAEIKEQTNE